MLRRLHLVIPTGTGANNNYVTPSVEKPPRSVCQHIALLAGIDGVIEQFHNGICLRNLSATIFDKFAHEFCALSRAPLIFPQFPELVSSGDGGLQSRDLPLERGVGEHDHCECYRMVCDVFGFRKVYIVRMRDIFRHGYSLPIGARAHQYLSRQYGVELSSPIPPHILNTPNFVSGTGALRAALKAKASTRRVSPGAMMPSSHSRAVA